MSPSFRKLPRYTLVSGLVKLIEAFVFKFYQHDILVATIVKFVLCACAKLDFNMLPIDT